MTQEASAPGSSACAATTTAAQKKLPTVGDLLQALTSHDNHARNSAERTFHAFKEKHPEALVFGLLQASKAGLPVCDRDLKNDVVRLVVGY